LTVITTRKTGTDHELKSARRVSSRVIPNFTSGASTPDVLANCAVFKVRQRTQPSAWRPVRRSPQKGVWQSGQPAAGLSKLSSMCAGLAACASTKLGRPAKDASQGTYRAECQVLPYGADS
jgi:hypothetical protein